MSTLGASGASAPPHGVAPSSSRRSDAGLQDALFHLGVRWAAKEVAVDGVVFCEAVGIRSLLFAEMDPPGLVHPKSKRILKYRDVSTLGATR
jgi:hypothetical protein